MEHIKTPFFLLKEDILEKNIFDFKNALEKLWPNSIIAYSVKTNSLPWILKWMNKHDVFAEVVSDEEYQLALLSGYTANKIVFNGPIKSDEYLAKAFENGSIINFDSEREIEFITRNKPTIHGKIGIRINVNPQLFTHEDVGYQDDGFRFGFSAENGALKKALNTIFSTYGKTAIGLHMHVNSITRSLDVYKAIASNAATIIKEYELCPSYIDIGGGFFGGVPGKPSPDEYIKTIRQELNHVIDISKTLLIIEPGSAAIGSAIDLHTSVLDVKDTAHGRIVTTDGSRIHIDPLWKKKNYMFSIDSVNECHNRQVICGYTCMDHDRIMVIEEKPELQVGDHIVYHRVGNYTVTFGGPFIRPNPAVYVRENKEIKMIRRQMDIKEYYKLETI